MRRRLPLLSAAGLPVELRLEGEDGRVPPGVELSAGDDAVGHGLIGMRERVAIYGGEISTGRRADGGFRVHASLPRGARS
jgi:glucose-6-phosphate-specific signal transduction histidine kinase